MAKETKTEIKATIELIEQIRERMKKESKDSEWGQLYKENPKLGQLCNDIDELCTGWALGALARVNKEVHQKS